MAYRDPDEGRAADRARFRRRTEQRKAAGLCPWCGERRPEDGLALCGACAEKRRVSEREAAASLVFARLSPEEVEIVSDAPITARVTGWT